MTQRRKLSRVDNRSPCIIGVARHTWREDLDGTPEPLRMWAAMAREAATDSQARNDVIAAIDDVGVVHCQSWPYDFPADRLAQVLDLQPGHRNVSILAGTSPQRLLNAAAERMLKGVSRLALVVGGEALATRRRLSSSGEQPPWSFADPDPKPPVDAQEWFLPTELAHGVLPAWLTFALLDQARAANSGRQFGDCRQACAQTMQRCNAVAAGNPHAWFPQPYTAKQIADPSPGNRWIAGPYTKRMTAFMDVDMAAGILMATHAEADRLGVPPERRVYLRGWAFARDATHLAARSQLDASAAMRFASQAALRAAGIGVDDVAVFDLYSCFPAALHFAKDALGLSADETRSLTATGGLPYHGGPSSNYMSHSVGHVVDLLRHRPGEFGLVSGIGMHMTKHVYACYSSDPGVLTPPDYEALQAAADEPERRVVDISAPARARIATAATTYSREGGGESLLAVCELPDGSRAYARTTEPEALAALDGLDWRERSVVLRPGPHGSNLITPEARLS